MLSLLRSVNEVLWGVPLLCVLLGTHLYFTVRLGFVQKHCFRAIKLSTQSDAAMSSNSTNQSSHSAKDTGFSGFGALATTLAATLGTGNITGVSTAVYYGGPGAVFWCWLTGILGMATTYAECFLSVKYQSKAYGDNETSGNVSSKGRSLLHGGPMYVLQNGLHNKWLAYFYAFCVVISSFGAGCTTQSNALAETASYLWHLPTWFIGMISAVIVGFVLVAGASSIEKFCIKLVPAMSILFLSTSVVILALNHAFLLDGLKLIFLSAFSQKAVYGGLFGSTIGFTLKTAARYGIARGLFTNEAGLGTAGITAAGSTASPTRQALISMTATFWDTVVCCAITGLVIITNMLRFPESVMGISAGNLTNAAFEAIPYLGGSILGVCMVLFAFATLIGWSYMGQQAFAYVFHQKGAKVYQTIYLVMIFLGAVMSLDLVWELTDTINFFMVVPNLIALYGLHKEIESP